jgi:hypothetical protein
MILLKKNRLSVNKSVYVGDGFDDQEALLNNNLHSVTVMCGYGDYSNLAIFSKIANLPDEINKIINN